MKPPLGNPSSPGRSGGTSRQPAILLLGPTGAGKTPLGECLEREGLRDRRCVHFDFGAQLRAVGAGRLKPPGLNARDRAAVSRALKTHALLEDSQFHIAAAILRDFLERRTMASGDWLVLNGLPRHVNQATDLDRAVRVEWVVCLDSPAEVVKERIRSDAGGDRAGRIDDAPDAVARKLRVYRERTVPILEHYRAQKVRIDRVEVSATVTPQEIRRRLQTGDRTGRLKA